MLRENGRGGSLMSDDIPMAMLSDIIHVFLQLNNLINKQDEQNLPHYQIGVPSKRQRMS